MAASELERVIGGEALARLSAHCGGKNLYIPALKASASHAQERATALVEIVGPDAWRALTAWTGGTSIYVPLRPSRHATVRSELLAGRSAREAARRAGFSLRQAQRIQAAMRRS